MKHAVQIKWRNFCLAFYCRYGIDIYIRLRHDDSVRKVTISYDHRCFHHLPDYRIVVNIGFHKSVSEGHPDKICDQVSDAILDACLEQDPQSKVARETCTETYMVIVFREITTKAKVNYEKIIAKDLKEHVIKPVIPPQSLDNKTIFSFNHSGRFVIGGPHGDAGLTGRKILIDTYGGCGAHGSGAFLGKDPTKVDRSGAYIVRQAAKSVVASGLARRCIVQVSYAIGVPDPVSVFVDTYKTGKIRDKDILALIKENFDFRPGMISIDLDLTRGVNFRYQKTAASGHFGRDDPDFTWETLKLLKPRKA
ncbi:hypothetical protein EUGRSUZ_J00370 [Eucalyptus grandis]|uniref:Uncharacterized protein n=2 Tax=Eucalyptus grandis TaxID=71139 RepID=A0ACC3J1Q0_EUCGR|nr:hypothetical protein EUGRSUZ_J00370 [Eucalyptus grandis]